MAVLFCFCFFVLFFFNVGLFLKIFRRVPLCTTPQHKLWHEKINTQYENKHENTSFSKQNQKKSKDNDSYHNLYETTITVFFFLSLTIYRLVYTQHKRLHLFLFELLLLQSSSIVQIPSLLSVIHIPLAKRFSM